MRVVHFLVLAAVLAAAGTAHAQASAYTARCTALTALADKLADADKAKAQTAIKTYCAAQAACLDAVRGALAKPFDQRIEWPACASNPPVRELATAFDGLADATPVRPAIAEENAFWQALNGALKTVGDARGEVATALGEVTTYTGKVRDREWPQVLQYAQVHCASLERVRGAPLYEAAVSATRDAVSRASTSLSAAVARAQSTDDGKRNRLTTELAQVERDLAAAATRVAQATADLAARKRLVDAAITTIGKCLDYRRAVMNVFATAQDRVRGENDPDVVPLARQLRDRWEASKRGHAIAISDKENALTTCQSSQP